ncbi:MAG: hypothetical protein LLG06_15235 [Desulfobacteraceae bacterium]|nr:hypothetical protein [Desulfobacteraceae bacterium]
MSESGRAAPSGAGPPSSFTWRVDGGKTGLILREEVSRFLKLSLEESEALIDFGSVYVRGRMERNPGRILEEAETVSVTFPPYGVKRFYELNPVRILFRDRHLLAYDKEPGTPSQQTPYDAYNNIFAALLRFLRREGSRKTYAALHHRLDLETSGLMLFALEAGVNARLGRIFERKNCRKEYLAWIEGCPDLRSWTCDAEIGKIGGKYRAVGKGKGKSAETVFRLLHRDGDRSLVWACPLTGRTHQIRIHLAETGHPVSGDRMYGAKRAERLYLHAWRLSLDHPVTGKPLRLEAAVPPEWNVPPEVLPEWEDGPATASK